MPGACIIRTVALLDAIISAWCPEEVYIVPGRNEGRGENEEIPHHNQCQHFFLLPASLALLLAQFQYINWFQSWSIPLLNATDD